EVTDVDRATLDPQVLGHLLGQLTAGPPPEQHQVPAPQRLHGLGRHTVAHLRLPVIACACVGGAWPPSPRWSAGRSVRWRERRAARPWGWWIRRRSGPRPRPSRGGKAWYRIQ